MSAVLLENGKIFPGVLRGYCENLPVCEVVFNTSLVGYQEILTDPSYAGQVVVMTYPQIGNYGVNQLDMESNSVHCEGLVVRELSEISSNFGSESTLEDFLIQHKISCMSEVDTRALTKTIRDSGAMRGAFIKSESDVDEAMEKIKNFNYEDIDYSKQVSLKNNHNKVIDKSKGDKKVAVIDFGIKSQILNYLSDYCELEVYTLEGISKLDFTSLDYDGYFLSNGPGDPQSVKGAKDVILKILDLSKPMFGICLGHQLLSLALGGSTYKLKFGHHGANHPIKNLITGKVEITSQNHGYAVDFDSVEREDIVKTHVNLNDGSLAGIMLKDKPVYSIQYHPEASPGPHDSNYLFEKFKKDLLSN